MSFWGKIIGSAVGFVVGGPFGAVLGASLGHAADEGALRGALPGGANIASMLGSRETLFAMAVVVLSAKLAKCDGPVRRTEIDAFKTQFRIPPENMKEVGELFDRARDSSEGFESYAQKLGEAFSDDKGMLEDVLAALFRIAAVDGPVNRAELGFLATAHRLMALDTPAWERAQAGRPRPGVGTYGGGQGSAPGGAQGGAQGGTWGGGSQGGQSRFNHGGVRSDGDGTDPYLALGLTRSASDEAVRTAWRRLVRENHPDSLSARGVPAHLVERATSKVAGINAAWDCIKRERGL